MGGSPSGPPGLLSPGCSWGWPQPPPTQGPDQGGPHWLPTPTPHSESGFCPNPPLQQDSSWAPAATVCPPTPWSQPRTASCPCIPTHVSGPESLPQASSDPDSPNKGDWVQLCPTQHCPSPSRLSLHHPTTPAHHPPFSLWTPGRRWLGPSQAHGRPGSRTSAPPRGERPADPAPLATLQGPTAPHLICTAGRLPPLCWGVPRPASALVTQPPASCPLLDCPMASALMPCPAQFGGLSSVM